MPLPQESETNSETNIETDSPSARFVVGIDLGTTNSAVSFVDTLVPTWTIRTFAIPQLVAPGEVDARDSLPSFHYEPTADEWAGGSLRMPWSDDDHRHVVGVFARDHGRAIPGRMIESAKSWLCHAGVDRRADLLPWHGAADVKSLSPVAVSARYLAQIRCAWDHAHADNRLSEQDIVLTIPASFDEVARELTIQAARQAGLPRVVLIEEPQAAFYSWVNAHRDNWDQHVAPGQRILVCDIGGGTTDFTLIHVRRGAGDKLQFHRVAVGNHLLLGGDNLDLALAHHIEHKLVGDRKLEPRQWSVLLPACRRIKETLLGPDAPDRLTATVAAGGSRLIGGSLQTEVSRQEVIDLLVDGFVPDTQFDDRPIRRQSGFQEFGLPYAADPAITKYLAAFLADHRQTTAVDDASAAAPGDVDPARPDIVLFNGGFFASPILRQRLIDVIELWFQSGESCWSPIVLDNKRLDLAVSRGAAYFGMVRRGEGERIVAGLARTYYVGVETAPTNSNIANAMCLIAAGTEPGAEATPVVHQFELRTSEPIEFPLYSSSTRLTDAPGTIVAVDAEQLTSLPPIRTVLKKRGTSDAEAVTAQLTARLTEIGTMDVWLEQAGGRGRWQLQFDVRSTTETDREAHHGQAEQFGIVDQESIEICRRVIRSTFAKSGSETPDGLPKRLARAIEIDRSDWSPSLLRNLWIELMDVEPGRRKSQNHEARWLNLLGFALRPGFGMAADDWRVAETWRTLKGKLCHATPACRAEWWVLWRRITAGLTRGQQLELASPLLALIRQKHRQVTSGRGKAVDYASGNHEAAEVWRFLGALELIERSVRIELGHMILDFAGRPKLEPLRPALLWALGRIGARMPTYGPLNVIVPPDVASAWIERLVARDMQSVEPRAMQLTLMQLARRTDDRYRDVGPAVRERAIEALADRDAPAHFLELVASGGALSSDEQSMVFGESLPIGLRIR